MTRSGYQEDTGSPRLIASPPAKIPRPYGLWTLPARFMENGETTQQSTAREIWEEACAFIPNISLYGVFNLPHINQIYVMFRGSVVDGQAATGSESLDVGFFTEDQTPGMN